MNILSFISFQTKISKRSRKRVDYDHCRHVVDVSPRDPTFTWFIIRFVIVLYTVFSTIFQYDNPSRFANSVSVGPFH